MIGRVIEIHSDFADLDRKEIVTNVTIAPTDVLKGSSGASLVLTIPGGVYLTRIEAVTSEGRVYRNVKKIVLVR